ncbi:MAG: type II secretion system protein GspG [Armatimonadetes bacterium]|nr:type II secretion system protein GspG [Armatimonadota bacterium]
MERLGRARRAGFTLVELMVVMVILVLLAALVIPRVMNRAEDARRATTIVNMKTLVNQLEQYRIDNAAKVPSTEQGLEALVKEPTSPPKPKRWKGPYIDQVPKDGWGNDFQYLSIESGRDFHLWSFGADGVEGGEGLDADIRSWERETFAEG